MLDPIYLMIEPAKLALWAIIIGMSSLALVCFAVAYSLRRRRSVTPNTTIKDAKDTIIMALLDDIAAQAAAIEATDAAAAAKIDALAAQVSTAQADAAAAKDALASAQADAAIAQALADRLKAANDALAAKVAA